MASTALAEPLLTTSQLAQFLGVPVNTVYAWRTRGLGPNGFRVGRHTRFRLEDVEAWLKQQQLGAAGP